MSRSGTYSFIFTAFVIAVTLLLTSCTKDTYEAEIERFYFETSNVSVNISSITVDTIVTFEQARPWLEKKLERVKERLTNTYQQQYEAARSAAKPDAAYIAALKAKLDSANAGLFSPANHEIKAFSAFMRDKPYFEQVTLRYKVWLQGQVQEQVFIRKVTVNDTTLRVTEKGVKEYLMY